MAAARDVTQLIEIGTCYISAHTTTPLPTNQGRRWRPASPYARNAPCHAAARAPHHATPRRPASPQKLPLHAWQWSPFISRHAFGIQSEAVSYERAVDRFGTSMRRVKLLCQTAHIVRLESCRHTITALALNRFGHVLPCNSLPTSLRVLTTVRQLSIVSAHGGFEYTQ